MSHMKFLNRTFGYLDTNSFKNMVIVFGVCLSLFTITSYDSLSNSFQSSSISSDGLTTDEIVAQQEDLENTDNTGPITEQKLKTHHNFIASYFLQESSIKREKKTSKEREEFIGQFLQLHKIIISKTFGSF